MIVGYAVPSLQAAARAVLAYGPFAAVLEPDELVRLVHTQAETIVKLHSADRQRPVV